MSDAVSICGTDSVVMWSRLDVVRRVDVMRVDVRVCSSERVAVSVSGATRVCCAVSFVMWSRLDGGRPVGVIRVDVMSVSLAACASPLA